MFTWFHWLPWFARADEPLAPAAASPPGPTMGGKQFWADRRFFHRWRIQQNVLTGHCRLLDEDNRRHAAGTFESCLARLDQIKRQQQIPPMRGRAVILLHGLFRTRESLAPLAKQLHEAGYQAFNVGYPTTRADVAWHARHLAEIVEGLEGIEEIHFVAHSLGNLVIRHYLADQADPATGRQGDPRIKRIVMLGPPNQGADLAVHLDRGPFYEWIAGPAAVQLGRRWAELEPKLATPKCQFGIIAGGSGDPQGRNPLLSGDDDYVVSVETTRLSGARDFAVLPVAHTFMMNDPQVQEYTLRFLEHGHFVSEDRRQPIE